MTRTEAQQAQDRNRDSKGRFRTRTGTPSGIDLAGPSPNSGYVGYSMSRRAVQAYENGEKPISKWTKAAMLETLDEIAWDNDWPDTAMAELKRMRKDDLSALFLDRTSWHHTSKHFNRTDFYSIDPDTANQWAWVRHILPEKEREALARTATRAIAARTEENNATERLATLEAPYRLPWELERNRDYIDDCRTYVDWWDKHGQGLEHVLETHGDTLEHLKDAIDGEKGKSLGLLETGTYGTGSMLIKVPPGTWHSCTIWFAPGHAQTELDYLREKAATRRAKIERFDAAQAAVRVPNGTEQARLDQARAAQTAAREARIEAEREWSKLDTDMTPARFLRYLERPTL